ncbi:hypothetical protein [Paenibacillus massiliensis]|uniref:hypothetical protein n=1 Tax=Paenibacillus massiliensis TaxID=225917 RepID=UPI00048EE354|nr:hypothetical protein [Paenibacillus massiliensis]
MKLISYDSIKNSIVLDFEEYIGEEGLNVAQVSAKTLEEDWRIVNDSLFTKTLYFVSIAIESAKYNEIADFICSNLDSYLENSKFEDTIDENEVKQLLEDVQYCKKLLTSSELKIIETTYTTKARVEYILGLKSD